MYTPYNSPPKFYIKFTLNSKTTNLKGKKPEFRFKPEDSHACMDALHLPLHQFHQSPTIGEPCYCMLMVSWKKMPRGLGLKRARTSKELQEKECETVFIRPQFLEGGMRSKDGVQYV